MKKSVAIILYFLIGFFVVSCNSGHVMMNGKITYSDNNEPLTQGTVIFVSDTFQARGDLRPDGSYSLGSFAETDGLPPGNYRVYLVGTVEYNKGTSGKRTPVKNDQENEVVISAVEIPAIDSKYNDPNTSGLTCSVDGSKKVFDFQVERAKQKK